MVKTVLAISLLVFVNSPPTSAGILRYPFVQSDTVEAHIARAQEAIDKKKYVTAKRELKDAIKLQPNSAPAYSLLAEVEYLEGDISDAVEYAERAIRFQPDYAHAYSLLAILFLRVNDFNKAQEVLDAGLTHNPQYAPLYVARGDCVLAMPTSLEDPKGYNPKFDSAIQFYETALSLASPSDPSLQILRERIIGLKNYIEIKTHKGDSSYTDVKALNWPRPNYTKDAERAGIEGTVCVGIIVNDQGSITSMQFLSRLGYGLDEEAASAVRKIRFNPAMIAGKPASVWLKVKIEFSTKQQ